MDREFHDGDVVRDGASFWLMRGYPGHTIAVPRDGRWEFNGDYQKPTFSPSINEGPAGSRDGHHFWVKNGVAEYLPDKLLPPDGNRFWVIPPWDGPTED